MRLLDVWTKELGVSEGELLDKLVKYESELFTLLAEEDDVKRVKRVSEWMKDNDNIIKSIVLERVLVDFICVIAGVCSLNQFRHTMLRIGIMLDELEKGGEKNE